MKITSVVHNLFNTAGIETALPSPEEYAEQLRLIAANLPFTHVPPVQLNNLLQWGEVLNAHAEALGTEPVTLPMLAALDLTAQAPYLAAIITAPSDLSEESSEQMMRDLIWLGGATEWLPNLSGTEHAAATQHPEEYTPAQLRAFWLSAIQVFSATKLGRTSAIKLIQRRLNSFSPERDCGEWLLSGPPRHARQLGAQLILSRFPAELRGELEPYDGAEWSDADPSLNADLLVATHGLRAWHSALGHYLLEELRELASGRLNDNSELTLHSWLVSGLSEWNQSQGDNADKRRLYTQLRILADAAQDLDKVTRLGRHITRRLIVEATELNYGLPPSHLNLTPVRGPEDIAAATTKWSAHVLNEVMEKVKMADWHGIRDGKTLFSGSGEHVLTYSLTVIAPRPKSLVTASQPQDEPSAINTGVAEEVWPSASSLKA